MKVESGTYDVLTGHSEVLQGEPFALVSETLLQHAIDSVRLVSVPLQHGWVQVLDGMVVGEPGHLTLARTKARNLLGRQCWSLAGGKIDVPGRKAIPRLQTVLRVSCRRTCRSGQTAPRGTKGSLPTPIQFCRYSCGQ
jgi:hypothetical protein